MAEVPTPDTHVPHEDAVDKAIDDQMARTSTHPAIPNLAAPSAGYVQAEAAAAQGKINEILAVLRDAQLIP